MKITAEQLRIYQKYGGDEDGLALVGTRQERSAARDADWPEIRRHIQALALASSGVATEEFRRAAIEAAENRCADEDAKRLLMEFGRTRG